MNKKQVKIEIEAAQSTADLETLEQLAQSESADVRWWVAKNQATSDELLMQLGQDPIENVRFIARGRLPAVDFERMEVLSRLNDEADHASKVKRIFMSTLQVVPNFEVTEVVGLLYASSSKMALGLNSQATRLENASESALESLSSKARGKAADAVLGLCFALNNSQGASAAYTSSEGVLVYGTAVKGRFKAVQETQNTE